MSITTRAAVAYQANAPLVIEELQFDEPVGREVLVKLTATGLCHSDLHVMQGSFPGQFPIVLGHEGAGIVLACGPEVTDLAPGDHVVPLVAVECGTCVNCLSGRTNICVHFAGAHDEPGALLRLGTTVINRSVRLGTFADHCIVKDYGLAKVRKDAPLEKVCCAGCCVTTGVGAAIFSAKVQRGATAIVFGVGGVGLNVVQGARLAQASRIIAVDNNPEREGAARQFGATDFVDSTDHPDLGAYLVELTGGGADHAFECVGKTSLMQLAMDTVHPRWGLLTLVGASPSGEPVMFQPFDFLYGKRCEGTVIGGVKGRSELPKIIDWYMDGSIMIDELITHEIPLQRINEGFDLMRRGESIRTVVRYV